VSYLTFAERPDGVRRNRDHGHGLAQQRDKLNLEPLAAPVDHDDRAGISRLEAMLG